MSTFNVYNHLIVPIGETLQADVRFAGLKIFYDRTRDKIVPRNLIPAINYFWISPVTDEPRGSGSHSLQTRRKSISIGFGCWNYDAQTPARLDEGLWSITGDLEDWLYEKRDFDPAKGISIKDTITADLDYSNDETQLVGSVLVTAQFELFSNPRGA